MVGIPVYNIELGDAEGLTKMSIVSAPAVESNFLTLSKDEPMKFSLDEEKHILYGCALRADFPIYRFDKVNGEYFVVFSKEVINVLYEKFMKEQKTSLVNLEHSKDVEGIYLVQSFIKDAANGISPKGFEDIEDGSWMVQYKVENSEIWERIKNGEFKGFSVEVFCDLSYRDTMTEDEIEVYINEILG